MIIKLTEEITSNRLILVEGIDDYEFLQRLIRFNGGDDIGFIILEGKTNLKRTLEALSKRRDYSIVDSIAIVLDADRSRSNSIQFINRALLAGDFNPPPNVGWDMTQNPNIGYFLFPDNNFNGEIEDLFLATISSEPVLNCVNEYYNCVNALALKQKKPSKAKVQVYLASKLEPTRGLDKAAQDGHWDYTSNALDDIRTFLKPLF